MNSTKISLRNRNVPIVVKVIKVDDYTYKVEYSVPVRYEYIASSQYYTSTLGIRTYHDLDSYSFLDRISKITIELVTTQLNTETVNVSYSLGGIAGTLTTNVLNEHPINFIKNEYNLLIGERTAEDIKMNIGAAFGEARSEEMDIRGRDMLTGLPKNLTITTAQVADAMNQSVTRIVDQVKKVLEETPPELSADIMDRGIILTGGGAMLYGLDELIRRETEIPTALADDPLSCVALGCGKALDTFAKFDGKATNLKMRY